jgi:hypothetical protein
VEEVELAGILVEEELARIVKLLKHILDEKVAAGVLAALRRRVSISASG